jgi:hypothetical protein
LMIFASRVRPSASRTAVARENIPTRDRGGFPATTPHHVVGTQPYLLQICEDMQDTYDVLISS